MTPIEDCVCERKVSLGTADIEAVGFTTNHLLALSSVISKSI